MHCIVLYCIVFYCIVLYCIVLYCIVLYCNSSIFSVSIVYIVYIVYIYIYILLLLKDPPLFQQVAPKMLFEHNLYLMHSRKTNLWSCKSTNRGFLKAIFHFEFPSAAILKCDVLLLQCQAPLLSRELNVDNWNDNCEAKSEAKSPRPLRGLQVSLHYVYICNM